MATRVQKTEVRIGEDMREPFTPASGVDVSDWNDWDLEAYLYDSGVLIATLTETETDDGQVIRGSAGAFNVWWKHELIDGLTVSGTNSRYFRQIRRVDSGNNTVLVEGVVTVKPYQVPSP